MVVISRFAKSFLIAVAILAVFSVVAFLHPPRWTHVDPWTGQLFGEAGAEGLGTSQPVHYTSDSIHKHESNKPVDLQSGVHGGVIMSKLGNATAKAALGRATWKLLHTMTLRFPEHPSPDERTALSSYFYLLSRLYPCGECAAEFQMLLKKFPPQTSSRRAAALWLCSVHNEVNKRLGKEWFDCANLDAEYDCGCGEEPTKQGEELGPVDPMDLERDQSVDRNTGIGMIRGG